LSEKYTKRKKSIILVSLIVIGICSFAVYDSSDGNEKTQNKNDTSLKKINNMNDEDILNLTFADVEGMSNKAQNKYYKRLDDIHEKERANETPEERQRREEELKKTEKEIEQNHKIENELQPIIEKNMDRGDYFGKGPFSSPKVNVYGPEDKRVIEVETICKKENDLLLNLDEVDVKLHLDSILEIFKDNDIQVKFDTIKVSTDIYAWHEKNDKYVAATEATYDELEEILFEPKIEIEKISY